MRILQIASIAAVLSMPGIRVGGATLPAQAEGHHSGIAARVVDSNGTVRDVRVDGAGCRETMCSRVFLMTNAGRLWLDAIASIKDSSGGAALFGMKDGTNQRTTVTPDWRVFYVTNESGRREKLDLTAIRSIEFFPAADRPQNRNK